MLLRKARTLVLAGVAAGSLTLLGASPAAAVGARPEDPTNAPEPVVPPAPPEPVPGAPGPATPAPPAPAPRFELQVVEPSDTVFWW